MVNIQNFLIKLDKVMDYIPVVSTFNNLVDLAQKLIFLSSSSLNKKAESSHYFTYIKNKSNAESALLLIPGIGNGIHVYRWITAKTPSQNATGEEQPPSTQPPSTTPTLSSVASSIPEPLPPPSATEKQKITAKEEKVKTDAEELLSTTRDPSPPPLLPQQQQPSQPISDSSPLPASQTVITAEVTEYVPKTETEKNLIEQAKKNDLDSILALTNGYYFGDQGVEKNLVEYKKWVEKGAELGNSDLQFSLYQLYELTNPDQANVWLNKAANQKNTRACEEIAAQASYEDPPNYEKALSYYKLAIESNSDNKDLDCSICAKLCMDQKKHEEALIWIKKTANKNFPPSQLQLARYYIESEHPNIEEATKLINLIKKSLFNQTKREAATLLEKIKKN